MRIFISITEPRQKPKAVTIVALDKQDAYRKVGEWFIATLGPYEDHEDHWATEATETTEATEATEDTSIPEEIIETTEIEREERPAPRGRGRKH